MQNLDPFAEISQRNNGMKATNSLGFSCVGICGVGGNGSVSTSVKWEPELVVKIK